MLGTFKALTIGGLISLQILGNPGVIIDTKENVKDQIIIEVQEDLIDELIDECDLEDADRFLNNAISDYLKGLID